MGFLRQEYWSRLPWPPPGDLPNPGMEPMPLLSPAVASGFFTTSAAWEALEPNNEFFLITSKLLSFPFKIVTLYGKYWYKTTVTNIFHSLLRFSSKCRYFCFISLSCFSICCCYQRKNIDSKGPSFIKNFSLTQSFFIKNKFVLFLAVLGLRCCAGFSLVVVLGLLIAMAPLAAEHGLQARGLQ